MFSIASRMRFASSLGRREVSLDEAGDVIAEPRDGDELGAVRHLVERDPEPEIFGLEPPSPLRRDDVRADEVHLAGAAGREQQVVLAEDLLREIAEQQARPGSPIALRPSRPPARHPAEPLRERVEQRAESVDVGVDPAGPVDDDGRAGRLSWTQAR